MDPTHLLTSPVRVDVQSSSQSDCSEGPPADAEIDIAILRSLPHEFCVADEKSANWLIRKVMASRQYAESVKVWAAQELRRAGREEDVLMRLFGRQLEGWAKAEIEKFKGRRKSVALPAGTVGFRTNNCSLQVDDEAVVIGWARRHCPPAIVTVEKLSRTSLRQHFESTGEVPDGAHVEPAQERFFVR